MRYVLVLRLEKSLSLLNLGFIQKAIVNTTTQVQNFGLRKKLLHTLCGKVLITKSCQAMPEFQ